MTLDTERLELDVLRAQEAERLNSSPILKDAYDLIENDLLQSLMNSPQRDKEGQLELVALLKLNRRYRNCLQRTIESGKIAQERISWLKKMQRRFAA